MRRRASWSFFSSHALVLLSVDGRPDVTVRELAEEVGLTERQVHRVLADLVAGGYVSVARVGRHNHYAVDNSRRAHGLAVEVGDLIATMKPGRGDQRGSG